jgi:integrase/recombinase XerD
MGSTRPRRAAMVGPLEPHGLRFATELARRGYAPSSVELHVRLVAHLSAWLDREDFGPGDLTPDVVESYFAARRAAGCASHRTSASLRPLLAYLRSIGVAPEPAVSVARGPVEALLERYRRYLQVERCLAPLTIEGYVYRVRPFVERRVVGTELRLESLVAGDVVAFVLAERPRRSRGSAKLTVTALRSLLRFLHVDGVLDEPLTRAVPSVAHWRLSGLPHPLEQGEVNRLLASCRLDTEVGRRDFAILKLLARLGLRAGEVARLQLDDIDWRAGEMRIHGKGGRQDRLPLPADVGEAVAEYVRAGRNRDVIGRCVFVRAIAPREPLTSRAVTKVVIRAGERAGLGQVAAHRLRHTAATDMLRAGASLPEIGHVLRHRRVSTTAIYAKVDREPLRELARPWPGGAA